MNSHTKKFLSYYKPYLGLFLTVTACAVIGAALALLLPLCVRYITKNVLENNLPNALEQIYRVGALMLVIVGIQTALNYFVDYRGHAMGAMMERDMRAELFEHFQKLPFRFYDEQRTGQLMSRITNDLFSLAELYHHGPEDYLIYSVRFAGAFLILFQINASLTFAILLFLPILAVFSFYCNKRLNAAMKKNKERIGDINAQVEDTLAGIRVVKSFANEGTETGKFTRENNRFLDSRESTYKNEAVLYQGVSLITQLITITVVVVGGTRILNTTLDLADLITFLLYTGYLIEPIQKLTHMTEQFQDGITGFERLMEMLAVKPESQDAVGAVEIEHAQGNIEFRNVGFRYQEDHIDVLKNITLAVKAGEYIALVGSSGVGKTTLCSLIPRFYEVSAGEIYLDGVNIR
ncbi:MAG: ABC transporter ATP-binding protein, partial [Chloroflexi bacterium]